MNQEHKIVLYQVEDTNIYVNVMFKEDTFWMTQILRKLHAFGSGLLKH